jgi:hypothetical protein
MRFPEKREGNEVSTSINNLVTTSRPLGRCNVRQVHLDDVGGKYEYIMSVSRSDQYFLEQSLFILPFHLFSFQFFNSSNTMRTIGDNV